MRNAMRRGFRRALVIGLIILAVLVGGLLWMGGDKVGVGLAQMYLPIRFRDVDHISPAEAWELYQQGQENPTDSGPLFVDVRTVEEWEVSHIPGAVHFPNPEATPPESVRQAMEEKKTVIIYCAAGYRSAEACRLWQAGSGGAGAGSGRMVNLNGAIFAWANAGYPITGNKVHPFTNSARWMVRKELR